MIKGYFSGILATTLVTLSALAPVANAVIVEGKFKGTIHSVIGSYNVINQSAIGHELSGHFWYDTAMAVRTDDNYISHYEGPQDWLNLTFLLNGETFGVGYQQPENREVELSYEYVDVQQQEAGVTDEGLFELSEGLVTFFENPEVDSEQRYAGLGLWNGIHNLLNGTELIQDFSVQSPLGNGTPVGDAYFSILGMTDGQRYETYIASYISDFQIGVRQTDVPEPSPLILLGLSLGLLGWRYRQQSSKN